MGEPAPGTLACRQQPRTSASARVGKSQGHLARSAPVPHQL